jgi:phosphoribosyl-AMP cyclohydrolase
MSSGWLDEVQWDENGLVPAIAQDASSGQVLMVAWMNRDALSETVQSARAVYWSRSRSRIWRKGEESGHIQTVQEVQLDCDGIQAGRTVFSGNWKRASGLSRNRSW